MFSEAEQNHLQSFLSEIEKAGDMNNTSNSQYTNNTPESSTSSSTAAAKKRKEKKRATPYNRADKSRSPSFPEEEAATKRGAGRARKPAHELLSEDQKKANHIASEQKRRANIRIGFDQLIDMVPALDSCHRSESLILQKSVDYIRDLVEEKNTLKEKARELQIRLGEVPDEDSSEGEMDYNY